MKSTVYGYLAALLATIVWAGNFIVARAFAFAMPPGQLNFWRWVFAFLAIVPFAAPHWRREWPAVKTSLRYLTFMGLIGITLMNAFIYKAGQTSESLNMALLMPATPLVILILARLFYHELIPARRLLGMLVAMTGILLLISKGNLVRLLTLDFGSGDLWTLGCMLCFALYSLFMRERPQNLTPAVFNAAVFGLGLILALPMVFLELWLLPAPTISWPLVGGILYSGLGCSTLCFWLWTIGIDKIGPVKAGIVYYSLPVFAALMAVTILGESINMIQITGGLLIIGGIFAASLPVGKAKTD